MPDLPRRDALKLLGATAIAGGITTRVTAADSEESDAKGTITELGQSRLSDPPGGYAEEDIRDDGSYGVLGSFLGEGGSFLVDLRDPTDPKEEHQLPSSAENRNADVAFDTREGLYYRVKEPNLSPGLQAAPNPQAGNFGIEVIDYGFSDEAESNNPQIAATIESAQATHNVFPHPEEDVLYATNEELATPGVEVYDVSDPFTPRKKGTFGPKGGLHDIVVDPDKDLLHAAYISDAFGDFKPNRDFAGYAILDVSDPFKPEVRGKFDYTDEADYEEIDKEGFENCHYADFDPEREIAIVGDEKGFGIPGGKHIFDIGYDKGSPDDPQPVGFTHSPNAAFQDPDPDGDGELENTEAFDWTTHNHVVIPKRDLDSETTLLVSGDYHEGTVVYDITDPTDPTPAEWVETDDGSSTNNQLLGVGDPPFAWGANYAPDASGSGYENLVITSDFITGVWTFDVTVD